MHTNGLSRYPRRYRCCGRLSYSGMVWCDGRCLPHHVDHAHAGTLFGHVQQNLPVQACYARPLPGPCAVMDWRRQVQLIRSWRAPLQVRNTKRFVHSNGHLLLFARQCNCTAAAHTASAGQLFADDTRGERNQDRMAPWCMCTDSTEGYITLV